MNTTKLWMLWIALSLSFIAILASMILTSEDKTFFMPGDLTGGHHQIGIACDACHGEAFTDMESMQSACMSCHEDQRQKPFDSHPREKFTDPRNADRLENIDALHCVTCHKEHKPEIAQKTGLTQPIDFCVHCHEDIGKDRPSHEGMKFNTCANAGCHNYHNNRSLYTDFLVKHMHEPDLLEKRKLPEKEFISVIDEIMTYPHDRFPIKKLNSEDIDAPKSVKISLKTHDDWLTTSHAESGVTCNACHLIQGEDESQEATWSNYPDHKQCEQCHVTEVTHFKQGKHGMRLQLGLSPMTPDQARLPMKENAKHKTLTCNSCHKAHRYDLEYAAIDACLECHDDQHSLTYKQSPHFELVNQAKQGSIKQDNAVTCASCHMPRVPVDVNDWLRRTVVQHNQNSNLVPNEKMIRTVCIHCHGLPFTIDALADKSLIKNNFKGKPSIHIESIDMAEKDNQRYLQETGGGID